MKWLISLMIVISIFSFSQSPKALEYYSAGMSAYLSGDYDSALKWFEKALTLSPDIESYDPKIKLKMGISAFMIGDYDTARDFLKLFPNDLTARNILKIIEKGVPQEEWEKWLMIPKEIETPSTPATAQVQEKEGRSPLLIYLGVFTVVFSTLMILELKFSLVTSIVARIPRIRIVIGKEVVEVKKPETVAEVEESVEEAQEEGEISVSFEEILNAPLDVVDKLIYGSEAFEGLEEETVKDVAESSEEEVETVREKVTEEKEEEEIEAPEEKPSTTELIKEIVGQEVEKVEEVKEEEEDLIEKAEKLLGEIKPEQEEMDLEEVLTDVEDLINGLEEKDEYTQEDADAIVRLLKRMVHEEEKENVNSQ